MIHYVVAALREYPEPAVFLTHTNIEGVAHGATSRESFP